MPINAKSIRLSISALPKIFDSDVEILMCWTEMKERAWLIIHSPRALLVFLVRNKIINFTLRITRKSIQRQKEPYIDESQLP